MRREVSFEVVDGLGRVLLDRPRAINALSVDMMLQLDVVLHAWANDESVESVELRGAGPRGFCSGADVRELRDLVLTDPARAGRFFDREYAVNALIAAYPKTVTAFMHGITMGGGLGLSEHASLRIAAPDLAWAMPETTIGFFPDVGVNFELSRAPGEVGTYLAMTGASIDADSAAWAGLVDRVEGEAATHASHCALSAGRWWIDECFVGDDAAEIVGRLERHWFEGAHAAGALIRSKSPLSVCVALAGVRRAATLPDVAAVLAQDAELARRFIESSDFVEGVRAQLVDKDHLPRWWHSRIEDVPADLVAEKFGDAG